MGDREPKLASEKGWIINSQALSRNIVEEISYHKEDPDWMREMRLKALEVFQAKPLPQWGGDLSELNFDDTYYYWRV